MKRPQVYADFQNSDRWGRVRLNLHGSIEALTAEKVELREGLRLLLSDGELQAEGMVTFSEEEKIWVAHVSWGEIEGL